MSENAYKHGYSGSCRPINGHSCLGGQATFSVGIFQWWPKTSGGVKKLPVKYRVRGWIADEAAVYERAQEICRLMDAGKWNSRKKSETVMVNK